LKYRTRPSMRDKYLHRDFETCEPNQGLVQRVGLSTYGSFEDA
jgi:hypothetical protein